MAIARERVVVKNQLVNYSKAMRALNATNGWMSFCWQPGVVPGVILA